MNNLVNFSRTVAGIIKWFWVILKGCLSYNLLKFDGSITTIGGSGQLCKIASKSVTHSVTPKFADLNSYSTNGEKVTVGLKIEECPGGGVTSLTVACLEQHFRSIEEK